MAWLRGLFVSGIGGVSLGRAAFWPVLGLALWTWGHGRDIPHGHLVTLLSLFGYLLGSKFRGLVKLSGAAPDPPGKGKEAGK